MFFSWAFEPLNTSTGLSSAYLHVRNTHSALQNLDALVGPFSTDTIVICYLEHVLSCKQSGIEKLKYCLSTWWYFLDTNRPYFSSYHRSLPLEAYQWCCNLINPESSWKEIEGKISIQATQPTEDLDQKTVVEHGNHMAATSNSLSHCFRPWFNHLFLFLPSLLFPQV